MNQTLNKKILFLLMSFAVPKVPKQTPFNWLVPATLCAWSSQVIADESIELESPHEKRDEFFSFSGIYPEGSNLIKGAFT